MFKKIKFAKKQKVAFAAAWPLLNPLAAGVDLGTREHWVAVPADRDPQPVRSFGTFTADLVALADWLKACGITSVAMEATGVYGIGGILSAHEGQVRSRRGRHGYRP